MDTEVGLTDLGKRTEVGLRGINVLCDTIRTVLAEIQQKREKAAKPKPKKRNK